MFKLPNNKYFLHNNIDEELDKVIRITNEAVVGNMENKDFAPCRTYAAKLKKL